MSHNNETKNISYNNLDDSYKRAFWRSFVQSIEINWTTNKKEIARVNFFLKRSLEISALRITSSS